VAQAAKELLRDPKSLRLMVVVADNDWWDQCLPESSAAVKSARTAGATASMVHLGPDNATGDFVGEPPLRARSSAEMLQRLGEVFQAFLGTRSLLSGPVSGPIRFSVDPYVRRAWLVVAGDGQIGALHPDVTNPAAARVDPDHRGGGVTRGLDGTDRQYRIALLDRPTAGGWTFTLDKVAPGTGYMLIQETTLGLRITADGEVAQGEQSRIVAELIDEETGTPIPDAHLFPDLDVVMVLDGAEESLTEDPAHPGTFVGTHTFTTPGHRNGKVHLRSKNHDVSRDLPIDVVEVTCTVSGSLPPQVEVDRPMVLSMVYTHTGSGAPHLPKQVQFLIGPDVVTLLDDGSGPDTKAGDAQYTGAWTPSTIGTFPVQSRSDGGAPCAGGLGDVEVIGHLDLGAPPPVTIGLPRPNACADGEEDDRCADGLLDLGGADVKGQFNLSLTADLFADGAVLEALSEGTWVPVPASGGLGLTIRGGEPLVLPLRLRTGWCCSATVDPTTPWRLHLSAAGPSPVAVDVPLSITLRSDPFLHCWLPYILGAIGLTITVWLIVGFVLPSALPGTLTLAIKADVRAQEWDRYRIRDHRGTRIGFYRDAGAILCADYAIRGAGAGGKGVDPVLRLRADGRRVLIQPGGGATIERELYTGTWEPIPEKEHSANFSATYRIAGRTDFYFQIRRS